MNPFLIKVRIESFFAGFMPAILFCVSFATVANFTKKLKIGYREAFAYFWCLDSYPIISANTEVHKT